MSAAYYLAFTDLRRRMRDGELSPDDLVFTVDADGQHDLDVIDDLHRRSVDEKLDALLVRRDLSTYPPYKQAGNGLLSAWATLWAGHRLHDVESGYRIFRLGALADALTYYRGYKYSETVEVAVVLCRLGYHVRNDVLVPVPVYRSRTRMVDVFIDLAAIPMAAFRVTVAPAAGQRGAEPRAAAGGHRAAAAVTGLATAPRRAPSDSAPIEVAGQTEQFVEPHRLETFRPKSVDDEWQRRQQHRAIGVDVPVEPVVQQDDRPGPGPVDDPFGHDPSVALDPVLRRRVPGHRMHALGSDLCEHERRALTVWGSEERGTLAQGPLEGLLGAVEFRVTRIEPTPIVMVVRVIRHEVAVVAAARG